MTCLVWLASIVAGIAVLGGAGWLYLKYWSVFGAGRYAQEIADRVTRYREGYGNMHLETTLQLTGAIQELEQLQELMRRFREGSGLMMRINPFFAMPFENRELEIAYTIQQLREKLARRPASDPQVITIRIPV